MSRTRQVMQTKTAVDAQLKRNLLDMTDEKQAQDETHGSLPQMSTYLETNDASKQSQINFQENLVTGLAEGSSYLTIKTNGVVAEDESIGVETNSFEQDSHQFNAKDSTFSKINKDSVKDQSQESQLKDNNSKVQNARESGTLSMKRDLHKSESLPEIVISNQGKNSITSHQNLARDSALVYHNYKSISDLRSQANQYATPHEIRRLQTNIRSSMVTNQTGIVEKFKSLKKQQNFKVKHQRTGLERQNKRVVSVIDTQASTDINPYQSIDYKDESPRNSQDTGEQSSALPKLEQYQAHTGRA